MLLLVENGIRQENVEEVKDLIEQYIELPDNGALSMEVRTVDPSNTHFLFLAEREFYSTHCIYDINLHSIISFIHGVATVL